VCELFKRNGELQKLLEEGKEWQKKLHDRKNSEEFKRLTTPQERYEYLREANENLAKVNAKISANEELKALNYELKLHETVRPSMLGFSLKEMGSEHRNETDRSTHLFTEYYNEWERRKLEVTVDDQGRLLDKQGRPLEGAHGYVLDPSGQFYQFTEDWNTRDQKIGRTHHSSPVAGG